MDQRTMANEMVGLLDKSSGHVLPRNKITIIQGVFECYLHHKLGADSQRSEITKIGRAVFLRLFDKKVVRAGCLQRLGRDADYKREVDDLAMMLCCVRTLLGEEHELARYVDRRFQQTGSTTKEIQHVSNRNSSRRVSAYNPGDRWLLPSDHAVE